MNIRSDGPWAVIEAGRVARASRPRSTVRRTEACMAREQQIKEDTPAFLHIVQPHPPNKHRPTNHLLDRHAIAAQVRAGVLLNSASCSVARRVGLWYNASAPGQTYRLQVLGRNCDRRSFNATVAMRSRLAKALALLVLRSPPRHYSGGRKHSRIDSRRSCSRDDARLFERCLRRLSSMAKCSCCWLQRRISSHLQRTHRRINNKLSSSSACTCHLLHGRRTVTIS
jgi:hypothetical protein